MSIPYTFSGFALKVIKNSVSFFIQCNSLGPMESSIIKPSPWETSYNLAKVVFTPETWGLLEMVCMNHENHDSAPCCMREWLSPVIAFRIQHAYNWSEIAHSYIHMYAINAALRVHFKEDKWKLASGVPPIGENCIEFIETLISVSMSLFKNTFLMHKLFMVIFWSNKEELMNGSDWIITYF